MPEQTRDDNQPGLWPLPEMAEVPPAQSPTRQYAASPSFQHRHAKQQADSDPTTDIETLWRIDDLAAHLGVPKSTIYGWRTTNYGPPAIKVGKHLRWRPEGVAEWAEKQELSDE